MLASVSTAHAVLPLHDCANNEKSLAIFMVCPQIHTILCVKSSTRPMIVVSPTDVSGPADAPSKGAVTESCTHPGSIRHFPAEGELNMLHVACCVLGGEQSWWKESDLSLGDDILPKALIVLICVFIGGSCMLTKIS